MADYVDTKVSNLVINNLTQEKYDELLASGQINPDELYCTPDTRASAVLFEAKWFDHIVDDMSWLRADNFTWHSGDVYKSAYEHLYNEVFGREGVSETIAGITLWFVQADDGHKVCPASEEANVQALYEATGVAWYYILDQANKQFKLPRTKFGFTGLRDTVGGYVDAGLPNITGAFANTTWLYNGAGSSGAFTDSNNSNYAQTTTGTGSGTQFTLNASRSSSVYGNSDTVQPPATQMYLYFYVGNFTKSAVEQTAGITSEQLNAKADDSSVVHIRGDENIGGVKNITESLNFFAGENNSFAGFMYKQPSNGNMVFGNRVEGNTDWLSVLTFGVDGSVKIKAANPNDITTNKNLVMSHDGTITWNGIPVICAKTRVPTGSTYTWYIELSNGLVLQGGRTSGTWEISVGAEQVPSVTLPIAVDTGHSFAFFQPKELYCITIGYYFGSSTQVRPRFGQYSVKRTLTQFDWMVIGKKA